jgi:N-acyl-D-aspartate/D-glutamate deacylase
MRRRAPRRLSVPLLGLLAALSVLRCAGGAKPAATAPDFDLVVRGGTVYDGSGKPGRRADVGIRGDRIAAVGDLSAARAKRVIDATGMAVAPGFVNMLSWATDSLVVDGRGMSDLVQGVTLEVMGEGLSMGPLNDAMKKEAADEQGDIKYPITWTTLGEYLEMLEHKGISTNVASFVGATTVRIHEVGYADREPTQEELARMVELVHQAMREGALGVGSSLIYPPAFYAKTPELVVLCRAAGEHGGMYISHMRSEGNRLLEAIDELVTIAREAKVPAEIYHFKQAGRDNWGKLDAAIGRVEAARAEGIRVSADMYTYTAGATGLGASMPPWVQEGGLEAWRQRLRDPAVRERVEREMRTPTDEWENLLIASGGAENVLLVGFKSEALKALTGKTLAQVSAMRGTTPEATVIDLVLEDDSNVGTIYFIMDEANVRREVALPWMSFGSDEASQAPEGVFLKSSSHPRAYGNFARFLGHYVRDEKLVPLAEAIRRLSALPSENLKLHDRGHLAPGYFADVVVFDPATIADRATYDQPQQLATGVRDVVVNGTPALLDGKHTGAFPGRVVRGPGWTGWSSTR